MGFEKLDRDTVRAIGSRGGKQAHASGHGYEWNPEQAAEAGRKARANDKKRRRKR